MTGVQTDFRLFTLKKGDDEVKWFVDLLRANGWLTRREVLERAGLNNTAHNQRWVRRLAQLAGGEVVRHQRGFNYRKNCTAEEITHARNQARSQAREMIKYYIQLGQAAHKDLEK